MCIRDRLYSGDIIKLVSRKIKEYDLRAVVDPVMVSESGGDLTGKSFIEYMKDVYKRQILKQQ